jgi:hypothetical protein
LGGRRGLGDGRRGGRSRCGVSGSQTFAPVGRPTGNAVAERTIRTMKEECVWLADWRGIPRCARPSPRGRIPSTTTDPTSPCAGSLPWKTARRGWGQLPTGPPQERPHVLGLARRHAREGSTLPLPPSRVPSQRAEARRAHDLRAVPDGRARRSCIDPRVSTPDFRTRECLDGGGTVQDRGAAEVMAESSA